MYSKIENEYGRPLGFNEQQILNHLIEEYSIDEIVNCIKDYPGKPLSYIQKAIKSKPIKKTPSWLNQEIVNKEITKEDEEYFKEFQKFIEDFRN